MTRAPSVALGLVTWVFARKTAYGKGGRYYYCEGDGANWTFWDVKTARRFPTREAARARMREWAKHWGYKRSQMVLVKLTKKAPTHRVTEESPR